MAPKGFSSENLLFCCSIETSSLFISISSFTDQTGGLKKVCLQFCIELKLNLFRSAVRSWDIFIFFETAAQCCSVLLSGAQLCSVLSRSNPPLFQCFVYIIHALNLFIFIFQKQLTTESAQFFV